MFIVAVDPGSRGHGFCYYDASKQKVVRYFETSHMLHIGATIDSLNSRGLVDVVVIEDFVGQGPRDPNAIMTLRMLGFIEGFAHFLGIEVVIQAPQIRRPFLAQAGALVGAGHHFTDATAHALAFAELRRRGYEGSRTSQQRNLERHDRWGETEDMSEVPDGQDS